jgi:hypothetical protein
MCDTCVGTQSATAGSSCHLRQLRQLRQPRHQRQLHDPRPAHSDITVPGPGADGFQPGTISLQDIISA